MRPTSSAVLAALALMAVAGSGSAVRADEAIDSGQYAKRLFGNGVAAKGKSFACFTRRYDAAHLARHPKQTVKSMVLLVSAELLPEDKQLNYEFQFKVSFRNRKGVFSSGGSCGHPTAFEDSVDKLHLGCGVDCDGGGVSLEMANSDHSVILRLDSVAIWNDSKPEDDERDSMQGGAGDRAFRLDRVELNACKSLMVPEDENEKPATM